MKRISILTVVLLTVLTSMTKGDYYRYYSWRDRVHWSIHTHGLIPGDVRYSPYARKHGNSGLVPYWVRYSPYAFSHKNPSGLVNDYASSTSSISYVPQDYSDKDSGRTGYCSNGAYRPGQIQESYEDKVQARKERIGRLKESRGKACVTRQRDGKEIIAQYLRDEKINFRTNRVLSIDDKTISIDFVLEGGNIIIKYWNPMEIVSLEQKPAYKKKIYERYLESWKDFCGKYQRAGGKIYQIISADTDEISAGLTGERADRS